MAPRITIPRLDALQQKERVLLDLAGLGPMASQLVAELRAFDAALASYATTQGTMYAQSRNTQAMTILCLDSRKQWMHGREIAKELIEGGFIVEDPKTAARYITDSLRNSVDVGKMQRVGDLYGLSGWSLPGSNDNP